MAPKKSIEKPAGKKPLSGYMKFAKERRPTLIEEKPGMSFGEARLRHLKMDRTHQSPAKIPQQHGMIFVMC